MHARILGSVLIWGLLLASGCAIQAEKRVDLACRDCSVLLISIDTLRADHLGCYGYDRPTSPKVDEFALDSVRFQNAIAHAPSTQPSHASIFTSLLPQHHGGWRSKRQVIAGEVKMMAEILKEAGLRTVSYNGGGQVAASWGFDRGFEIYESSSGTFGQKASEAIKWWQQNRDQRFFMFLHTYEVHAPYDPEPAHMELFDADYAGDLDDKIQPRLLIDINDGSVTIDEQDARHIVNAYDAEIRSMDSAFGKLLNYMRKTGLLDKTVVIFTSDHGEEFGEHGQMGQHSHALYDELLRVPLLIRLPGAKLASTVIEPQARGIDILPTLADILGLEALDQFDGSSLTGLMTGEDASDRVAISQIDAAEERPTSSIRTGSSKLLLGSQTFVPDAAYRWYESKVELTGRTHDLRVPIESFHVERRVRISVDRKPVREAVIYPERHWLRIPLGRVQEHVVTIEAIDPCTKPEDVGVELDAPCVSFRVFNPFEYFRLDKDPAEQHNLFDDSGYHDEVVHLRRQLDEMLSSRPAPSTGEVRIDRRTRERLEALGYAE